MADALDKATQYERIIELIFDANYTDGAIEVAFLREEIEEAADAIGISRMKNPGDVLYAFRYRRELPQSIRDRAPEGLHWIIRGTGRARYSFVAVPVQARILPNEALVATKIPDATPEIIASAAKGDEQALLALVRYNRLLDIFLGITTYSLQNHMRTTAKSIGQVEIDEIYVAVDRHGVQYVLPVQAKGGKDEIGVTQAEQDLAVCGEKWPQMIARPIAAQFMPGGKIALFELTVQDDQIRIVQEAHYRLVAHGDITDADRQTYTRIAQSNPPRL